MKNIFKIIIIFLLRQLSKVALLRHRPYIIAVTGSVGKTSTKDAIYSIMERFYSVRKTQKSYNSDLGIPLTILGLSNELKSPIGWLNNIGRALHVAFFDRNFPSHLILEIGADRPGEIKSLMKWIHPDASIVTRVGKVPVHVEFYVSQADVAREKSHLIKGLKNDGIAILNFDDEDVLRMKNQTKARIVTFGFDEGADICASNESILYDENGLPEGLAFKVQIGGTSIPVSIMGTLGRGQIYPALSALALSNELGLNILESANVFSNHQSPKGRMKIIHGINDSIIIDDSYNSSPVALEEGFRTIKEIKGAGRKIGLLGDMLELGRYSGAEHKRLGREASQIFDVLYFVGLRSRGFSDGALESGFKGEIKCFDDSQDAGEFLKGVIQKGDIVYAKASQGVRLEKALVKILASGISPKEALVRQEEEWMK